MLKPFIDEPSKVKIRGMMYEASLWRPAPTLLPLRGYLSRLAASLYLPLLASAIAQQDLIKRKEIKANLTGYFLKVRSLVSEALERLSAAAK